MRRKQDLLSGPIVVFYILMLTKSETAGFTVNGVEISSNRTCSSKPNVTCFVYFIRDQGCSAKAVTAFPHLYDVSKENKFPEKPQSMVINPFHKKYPSNHKYYPGLTISLKAPDTASFEVLKGFELIYSYNLDSNYGCLIFDLSAAKLTYTDALETDFWANIWPMKVTDAPAVLLVSRSLPPAPAEYDRYLNATENAGTWGEWGVCPANSDCMDNPTLSSQWVTTVMNKALTNYSGHFNQIQVVFALAPPEFSFTIYTISLYNVNDMSPVSAVNVTKDFPSHVFKRISPGTYIVKVLPFDPYFNQGPDRCLCKNEYSSCSPCTPTVTRGFTVGYSMYRDLTAITTAEQVLPLDPYNNQGSGRCLCKNENGRCLPCTPTITSDSTVGYNLVSISDVSSQAVYHNEGNICLIAAVLGGCFGVLHILFF